MTDATLYYFPWACSRVTMTTLDQAGVDYKAVLVDGRKCETRSGEYLKANPHGKVPAVLWRGRIMRETRR
ncbi:glutathione S-transferase [Hyphomonas adhaerens MHS-3]|uniref:Glutathione S-transferase n=1 Tax=Hyphomonas adhaerens MHS-3 TaxID=1280949 RepID=A0A069E7N9_9PROT|nr:glutathione S-transferase N-terminal domain-containing protein [Hyphomonas adhaerens]KCZ86077.1 glutathione S-transferase [Hyphomonas adhaerens MHS-3]